MRITQEYLDSIITDGRKMLKPDWKMFNHRITDQGKKIEPPTLDYTTSYDTVINLPAPNTDSLPNTSFYECAESRTSVRKFSEDCLTQNELSFLIWETARIKEQKGSWSRRPIPSAGGRHCLKTYLYIDRVQDIPKGIYLYVPGSHSLRLAVPHTDTQKKRLCKALLDQDYNSQVIFLWSAVPYVMEYRYSTVAHKMIAMEAGHICQNLHLACESIGCGSCAISAYYQSSVDKLVKVDGEEEFVIYTAVAGRKQNNQDLHQ